MRQFSEINNSHRKTWNKYVELSAVFTILFLITGFYSFPKLENKSVLVPVYYDDPIQVVDIIPTRQVKLQTMPQFIKTPKKILSVYKPVNDLKIDIVELEKSKYEIDMSLAEPSINADSNEDSTIDFQELSEIPEIKSVGHKLKYPSLAQKAGIEGTVSIKAMIDKDGNVFTAELLKSVGAGCDEEALEYVKELRFKPGTQREKPVKVWMVIPVKFKLKSR